MSRNRFYLTEGAIYDYRKAAYESARDFGKAQSAIYRKQLREGFQKIADNHENLKNHHREELAEGTTFKLHLVQHHYVAYQVCDGKNVIIAAVLPESMDIPGKLRTLQTMDRHEIDILRREIGRLRAAVKN